MSDLEDIQIEVTHSEEGREKMLGKKQNRDSGMDRGNIKISNIQIIGILEADKRENGTKAV